MMGFVEDIHLGLLVNKYLKWSTETRLLVCFVLLHFLRYAPLTEYLKEAKPRVRWGRGYVTLLRV